MDRESDARLSKITRRHFFKECGNGIGVLALASLLNDDVLADVAPRSGTAVGPHFAPRARRICPDRAQLTLEPLLRRGTALSTL